MLPEALNALHLEGRLSEKHFVEQNSQGPNVRLIGVKSLEQDFRRHIFESPAKRGADFSLIQTTSPSEVTDLHIKIPVEKEVFGLQISVGVAEIMEILDGESSLVKELEGNVLGESVLGMDEEEERAIGGELLEEVGPFFVEERVHEGDDVRMVKFLVNLNFVEKRFGVFQTSQVYLVKIQL